MKQAMRFSVDPGWKLIAKDLNISMSEILKRIGVREDIFSVKEGSLSVDEYFALWKALEESANSKNFPLVLGTSVSVEAFSPPLFAAFCSPNAAICMQRLSRFKKLIGPMLLDIHESQDTLKIKFSCLGTNEPLPPFLIAFEMVFLIQLIRLATRERVEPLLVETITLLSPDIYQEYFGIAPSRGDHDILTISKDDALRPFLTENETMWKFFEPQLQKRLSELEQDTTFSGRVRAALMELLPAGQDTATDVAAKLKVSKRTLQRNLSNESTTFQKQLNHTRELLARHYLTSSEITMDEISFLIGYDDPNSFARAFHLWTGKTPGEVRRESLSA